MKKRFGILLPVFNRPDYARQAIDSVLSQTFSDYELIVIDDGSTDDTQNLLRSYGTKIKVIRQENQGPEVARNAGALSADTEYLAFLDSDDLFVPTALETYEKIIKAFNAPPIILGSMNYFQDGHPYEQGPEPSAGIAVLEYRDFLSKKHGIEMSSSKVVMRKDIFDKVGGFRKTTSSTFQCDDYNLILRTCTYGPCVEVINPRTVAYRTHASNTIRNLEGMIRGIVALARAERSGAYPGGRARRFARYACLGGPAVNWIRKALNKHRFALAFYATMQCLPMIVASVLNKLRRFLPGMESTASFDIPWIEPIG
jgi:glycosyltransferase involved in cell wall biosynthesis